MQKLVLIDGNSILNRAFYAIMGSRMLMSNDKMPTNAIFGFLSTLFKVLSDEKPEYIAVAFDLKAPTFRHKQYEGYKAQRKGMPNELAEQLPVMKDILRAMNIKIYEKEGYEADDILGTLACYGEKQGLKVILLTGDRDSFQLTTENINPKIPTTKAGKTTEELYTPERIKEKYGIEPKQFIQVKALMGDASDNIPGVPGVGEKTALSLIQKFKTLDNVYKELEAGNPEIKGKLKERLIENKELAYLSRDLGTICLEVPIETNLEDIKLEEYNSDKLYEIFKNLNFNKYIEKLGLKPSEEEKNVESSIDFEYEIVKQENLKEILTKVKEDKYFSYNLINNEEIVFTLGNKTYYYKGEILNLKEIFESKEILKIGYKLKEDFVYLNTLKIYPENMMFDIEIAAYILNSLKSKYEIEELADEYLNIDVNSFIKVKEKENEQLSLLSEPEEPADNIIENNCKKSYLIYNIYKKLKEELEKNNQLKLFETIEMPLVEVLASMQIEGMHVDKKALEEYGKDINSQVENLTNEIYALVGQEFNINSPKQLRRNIV